MKDLVAVPKKMLEELEAARRELVFVGQDGRCSTISLMHIVGTMYRVANKNWPKVTGIVPIDEHLKD